MMLYRENILPDSVTTEVDNSKERQYSLPRAVRIRRVKCVQTKQQFMQLKDEWNSLVASSKSQNPFMLWEWLYTWWDIFENNQKLFILAVYDNEKLISLAPFYIKKSYLVIKQLAFLGEGEKKSDAIVTHYPDVIVSEKNRQLAVSEIVKYLRNDIGSTHLFHFSSFDLVKEDAVIHDISTGLGNNISLNRKENGFQFMIPLPKDDEKYFADLSKSVRKQFRLKSNRLNKLGELKVASETSSAKGLEIAERLHRARWESITPTSIFDSKAFKSFHSEVSKRFEDQDIFDIRTMRLNDKSIVVSYNLNYQNKCYSYLGGFESEDDNRLSPMFIFDILELKRLIREKYEVFDLLVSESPDNYKKRFGGEMLPVYKVMWFKGSPLSQLVKQGFALRPHLAKIYRKIKPS